MKTRTLIYVTAKTSVRSIERIAARAFSLGHLVQLVMPDGKRIQLVASRKAA